MHGVISRYTADGFPGGRYYLGLVRSSPDVDQCFSPAACRREELASDGFRWWMFLVGIHFAPIKNVYNVETVRLLSSDTRASCHFLCILELICAPVAMCLAHLVLHPMAPNSLRGSDTGRVFKAAFTRCD